MYPVIAHIYGPFAINSYGLMIALGLMLFTWLTLRDQLRPHIISQDNFINVLMLGIVTGVIGGRLLFVMSTPEQIGFWQALAIWNGGLSFLGSLLAILITIPWYLHNINTPILPFLDLISLYAPLLYAISRIGCFLAGCCYGLPTCLPWGITYTHPESLAPLCTALHPTQLYSSLSALGIFIIMQLILRKIFTRPGQLISCYLMLAGIERFFIDFIRNDRLLISNKIAIFQGLSIDQLIALTTLVTGIGLIVFTSLRNHR